MGPFRPAEEVTVPLWLAARMKKNGQCMIVPPKWLSVEYLEKVNNTQQRTASQQQEVGQLKLPYRWMEIANRILSVYVFEVKITIFYCYHIFFKGGEDG